MQDDWLDWLLMVEFIYNNMMFEIMKISLFLANSGQHSRMRFKLSTNTPQLHYQAIQVWEANEFVWIMSNLEEYLKSEIKWAQAVYEFNANQKQDPAPAYQVGDYVYIDACNMKIWRPSKKLD